MEWDAMECVGMARGCGTSCLERLDDAALKGERVRRVPEQPLREQPCVRAEEHVLVRRRLVEREEGVEVRPRRHRVAAALVARPGGRGCAWRVACRLLAAPEALQLGTACERHVPLAHDVVELPAHKLQLAVRAAHGGDPVLREERPDGLCGVWKRQRVSAREDTSSTAERMVDGFKPYSPSREAYFTACPQHSLQNANGLCGEAVNGVRGRRLCGFVEVHGGGGSVMMDRQYTR